MSPMAPTITDQWSDGKRLTVVGTIVVTGNYPGAAGDPLSFVNTPIQHQQPWINLTITGRAAFFMYTYIRGTTRDNGTVRVAGVGATAAGLTEHTVAAYAAGILADTLDFFGTAKFGI